MPTSIQDKINSEVNKGHRKVVIQNLSGDANIPERVNVDFYNCNIGSLSISGNSNVTVVGGQIKEISKVHDSKLIVHGNRSEDQIKKSFIEKISYTKLNYKETQESIPKVTIYLFVYNIQNSYLEFKNVRFERRIKEAFNSEINIKNCQFFNTHPRPMPQAVTMTGGTIRISESTVEENYDDAFVIHKGHLEVYDCPIINCSKRGVQANTGSTATVARCLITASGRYAVEAIENSMITAADCETKFEGLLACARAYDGSTIKISRCRMIPKAERSIIADLNSTVICNQITVDDGIKGIAQEGIFADNNSEVVVNNSIKVKSDSVSAIVADNGSSVILTDVIDIEGQLDGIELDNGSSLTFRNVTKIEGQRKGITADNSSKISGSCDIIESFGGEAIFLDNSSQIDVQATTKIFSHPSDGVSLANYSKAVVYSTGLVRGDGGSGALITNWSQVTFKDTPFIKGTANDGVTAQQGSNVSVYNAEEIHGVGRDGIRLETNSKAEIVSISTFIKGTGNAGIYASGNCSARLKLITSLIGEGTDGIYANSSDVEGFDIGVCEGVARDGVYAISDSVVTIKKIALVLGTGRDGIRIDSSSIFCDQIGDVQGSTYSLSAWNGAKIKGRSVDVLSVAPTSLYVLDSEVDLRNTTFEFKTALESGSLFKGYTITHGDKVDITEGQYLARECDFQLEVTLDAGYLKASNCSFDDNLIDDGNSETQLYKSQITGDIAITNGSCYINQTTVIGETRGTGGSSLNINSSDIQLLTLISSSAEVLGSSTANINISSSSSLQHSASSSGAVTSSDSGIVASGTSASSWALTNSGGIFANVSGTVTGANSGVFGSKTTVSDTMSHINLDGSNVKINATGSINFIPPLP